MQLTELLNADRVAIERGGHDGRNGLTKALALSKLASMLANGAKLPQAAVEGVLVEREHLQSTGIGEGVAIPHGALAQLEGQCAALLIVPDGLEFAAIDGVKVNLLFAVIGPKRATGEHLKTLARVSRLLRSREFRDRLVHAPSAEAAFALIANEEGGEKR